MKIPQYSRYTSVSFILVALLGAVKAPASDNEVMTFGGSGSPYVLGATVIGVDDPHVANNAVWTHVYGSNNRMTVQDGVGEDGNGETATGLIGGRAFHIQDDSVGTAYGAQLSLTGTVDFTREFTVSVSLKAGGTNAKDGSYQAQFYCGEGFNDSWVIVKLNGNDIMFYTRLNGALFPVHLGKHEAQMVRISAVVDPVTRTFKSVTRDGVDYTSVVKNVANGAGAIPCLSSGNPSETSVQLISGTDDVVTVDFDNIRVTNSREKYFISSSEEWMPYLYESTPVQVQAGSALDLSGLSGLSNPPIAILGRIGVGPEGDLVYADGTPARLFCAAETMDAIPLSDMSDGMKVHSELEAYVNQLVRAGYNCFRPHFLDHFLMEGSDTDGVFDATRYDVWKRLVKILYDHNVYLYLDASTSWCAYYAVSDPTATVSKLKRLKTMMYWDTDTRMHWKAAVTRLFTEENQYFNDASLKKLSTSPQVVGAVLRNEAGMKFQLANDSYMPPTLQEEPGLKASWVGWLADYYGGSIGTYNAQWGSVYGAFEDVPMPLYDSVDGRLPLLQCFLVELEQETSLWLQSALRDVGVECLLFDYNSETAMATGISRDVQDLVDNHSYHDHGASSDDPAIAWTHHSMSSFENTLQYLRVIAQSRIWGKPMTVTEWGHVYPNPWRHESGLTVPSYASLQGWSLIAQHAHPVAMSTVKNSIFWVRCDPPAKASEYMCAFLYRRGDVSQSSHRLNIEIDPSIAYHSRWGIPWAYNAASLLTGVGITIQEPDLILDDFLNALNDTLEANLLAPGVSFTDFWNTSNSSNGSTVDVTGGRLTLTSSASAYPSAIIRSGLKSEFNFFAGQMCLELQDVVFGENVSIPADKKRLRLVMSSQTATPYSAEDAVVAEISASNQIRVAYKVDEMTNAHATSINVVFERTLKDYGANILEEGSIETIRFTPISVVQADLTAAAGDPMWELLVFYRNSEGQRESQRFSGRWHANAAYSDNNPLVESVWGTDGSSCLQIELQKTDGVSTSGILAASLDSFRLRPQLKTGDTTAMSFDRSYAYDGTAPALDALITSLKAGPLPVLPALGGSENQSSAFGTFETEGGIFHSDTQEIRYDQQQRSVKVETLMSEGLTLVYDPDNPSTYPRLDQTTHVEVENITGARSRNSMTVFVTSLTETPLAESDRLLLIISTDAVNKNEYFTDYSRRDMCANFWLRDEDGNALGTAPVVGLGELPVLLRRSDINLTLTNSNAASLKVYPLNPDGTRQNPDAPIGPTNTTASTARFHIDTGYLPPLASGVHRPAVYFEVATD